MHQMPPLVEMFGVLLGPDGKLWFAEGMTVDQQAMSVVPEQCVKTILSQLRKVKDSLNDPDDKRTMEPPARQW